MLHPRTTVFTLNPDEVPEWVSEVRLTQSFQVAVLTVVVYDTSTYIIWLESLDVSFTHDVKVTSMDREVCVFVYLIRADYSDVLTNRSSISGYVAQTSGC